LLRGWDWPAMGYTHTMKMARLRAIENGYSLMWVDFDGSSAALDRYGRALARQDTVPGRGGYTLIADLPAQRIPTLYGHIGDVFAWLCLTTALALCGLGALRPVQRADSPTETNHHEVLPQTS
jgi:apolipoprotein N-acyltransferase